MQDTDQTDNSNQHSIVFMEREVLAKAHRKKKSGKKVDNRKKGQKDAKLNQDAAAAAIALENAVSLDLGTLITL